MMLQNGGAIIAIVGLLAALAAAYRVWKIFSIRYWPVVEGVMVEKGIKERSRTYWPAAVVTFYAPCVRFEYSVNGVTYLGERICVDESANESTEREEIEKRLAEFPERLNVHYDPRDPSQALLDVEPRWVYLNRAVTLLVAGLLVATLGISVYLISR